MLRYFLVFALFLLAFPVFSQVEIESNKAILSLENRASDLEKEIREIIKRSRSMSSFSDYADIRNRILRFLPEIRREISRIKLASDRSLPERVQLEQELKILNEDLKIDFTDDDSRPLSRSLMLKLIEDKQKENSETLAGLKIDIEADRKIFELRRKLRDPALAAEERKSIEEQIRPLTESRNEIGGKIRSERSIRNDLAKLKTIITKIIAIEGGNTNYIAETEKLESLENKFSVLLQQLDDTIFNFITVENNNSQYTLYSTIVFGLAVVIVIGSFFFVAYKSEAVRISIFANDSGLQFVTLFSLVIAIILFGVLKILEGRELAALLGGLSGYILGRGGISRLPSNQNVQTGINQAVQPLAGVLEGGGKV